MEGFESSRRSVLIVEDDNVLRNNLKKTLESMKWTVRNAANGAAAKKELEANSTAFDLIISDVRMPELDGISLLRFVRARKNQTKFILMTGFSEVVEAKVAYGMGADEFISKPFRLQTLNDAINSCFKSKQVEKPTVTMSEPETIEPKRFCQIPVKDFITASRLQTDIYIRLGESKYVKIAHAGDAVPIDRLKVYMEKEIDTFYVLPEDMRKIVGLSLKVSKIAKENSQLSRDKRLKLFKQTATLVTQNCYFEGLDRQMLKAASETIDSTLSLITQDEDLLNLLSMLNDDNPSIYAHSVAVAAYSCMMGKKLGMESAKNDRIQSKRKLCPRSTSLRGERCHGTISSGGRTGSDIQCDDRFDLCGG